MRIDLPFKFNSWQDVWLVQRNPFFMLLHRFQYLITGNMRIKYSETHEDDYGWEAWLGFFESLLQR